MSAEAPILLVVAASGRALAASARRAGYRVRTVDGFCDLDTCALGPCLAAPMQGSALDLRAVRDELQAWLRRCGERGDAVAGAVVGAGLESAPEMLAWLSARMALLGNAAEPARQLLDPARYLTLLDEFAIDHPESRLDPPSAEDGLWLVKEMGSSGGLGVRHWGPSEPRPRGPHYFQRLVPGTPGSLLFLANGSDVAPVGFNRLLISETGGDLPFLYGGALSGLSIGAAARRAVEDWARRLTRRLGLRGLNGIDFILRDGRPSMLELNARPPATLSLYDTAVPGGLLSHHIAACRGELPRAALTSEATLAGQSVLYAWRDLRVGADLDWPDWTRDRPCPGTRIPRGAPLCSLFAEAETPERVEALLKARVRSLVERFAALPIPAAVSEEIL